MMGASRANGRGQKRFMRKRQEGLCRRYGARIDRREKRASRGVLSARPPDSREKTRPTLKKSLRTASKFHAFHNLILALPRFR